jgi:putative transcriptional regulator
MGSKFFESIKKGLEEAIAHEKGEITLRSHSIELPSPPKYKAKDIKKIRVREQYSQSVFAQILNVSPKTIQAWESGMRVPSHAALRLLEIVDKGLFPISENTLRKRVS